MENKEYNAWVRQGLHQGHLERLAREMNPRTKPFQIIKDELKRRGYWKGAPKGRPFSRGTDERRNNNQY